MKRDRDGTEIEELTEAERAEQLKASGAHLPVIIDAPGWYRIRDGRYAHVDKVSDPSRTDSNCKGNIYLRGKTGAFEFSTWRQNGRWKTLGECPKDIVEKCK